MREWDRRTIEDLGLPGIALMENAGAAAARVVLALAATPREPVEPPFHVFCGPGNNGGDGFVVARHLDAHGLDVRVVVVGDDRGYRPGSDAAVNLEVAQRAGIAIRLTAASPDPADVPETGTVIDALFGTGLSRALEPPFRDWVRALARCPLPSVALDTPSGLCTRTGTVLGEALPARHTITFAARKIGFRLGDGPSLCGTVHVVGIGMPRCVWT